MIPKVANSWGMGGPLCSLKSKSPFRQPPPYGTQSQTEETRWSWRRVRLVRAGESIENPFRFPGGLALSREVG